MTPECRKIRRDILRISRLSGHGHIPTCFSVVELLYAAYATMRHDPENPSWEERDLFVLSKGHAALAHYCVLAHFGYFAVEQVSSFGGFRSKFGCHADRHKVPGVEASTGSLGHGIGLAVGMTLANRILGRDRRVITLIGDGEANEGSVWEALMVATDLGVPKMTVLYDNNMSHERGLQIHNPADRFRAFGFDTVEVDGHNVEDLKRVIGSDTGGPRCVVAGTTKGYGCPTMACNHYAWHRRSPDDAEFEMLMGELDEATV